jgi:hypothetical protein
MLNYKIKSGNIMVHFGNVESSHECRSWAMGLFNNYALAYISWVIFKLKNFYLSSLNKFFLYPSHWDVLLVITKTNIHQPIKRAKQKHIQGLFAYQCQKNTKMSCKRLITWMCKTNLEARHKLLEAQQVKMRSNFIEKMK